MDIQIVYNPTQAEAGFFDLAIKNSDLATENELQTAIIISLFSNRRAEADDILPDSVTDRQGWWGDDFAAKENDRIGSRLWLLNREKQTNETLLRAMEYAGEALEWLVEDGVASRVKIQASYPYRHRLALGVEFAHADSTSSRYAFLWDQMQEQVILLAPDELTFDNTFTYLITEDGSGISTDSGESLII